jgi:hypothetical protein
MYLSPDDSFGKLRIRVLDYSAVADQEKARGEVVIAIKSV